MPRVPEVYDEKTKWTLNEESRSIEEIILEERLAANYSSAVEHMRKVEEIIQDDLALGRIRKFSWKEEMAH